MREVDLETWDRRLLYEHFIKFKDPYFGIVAPFDVSKAFKYAKSRNLSFFGVYLHACMLAINDVDAFKLRIIKGRPVSFETIHASATIMRENKTFGFSFVGFNPDLASFLSNLADEKDRIQNSDALFPPENGLDCIHCSAMPWIDFSGHKEPVSGLQDSVPKLAFSKANYLPDGQMQMKVAINVNHALMDGVHVSQFCEKFQHYLNS